MGPITKPSKKAKKSSRKNQYKPYPIKKLPPGWVIVPFATDYAVNPEKGVVVNRSTWCIIGYSDRRGAIHTTSLILNSGVPICISIHRIIMKTCDNDGETPEKWTVDHINIDPSDNRLVNLRWASPSEQALNKKTYTISSPPITRINISTNEKTVYESIKDAALAIIDEKLSPGILSSVRSGIARTGESVIFGSKWIRWVAPVIEEEEWMSIPPNIIDGTKGYMISDHGRLKPPSGVIRFIDGTDWYITVSIMKIKYYLHRLVAQVFIPNPESYTIVNHIDGLKNNPHIDNLEWVTSSENRLHAIRNGLVNTKKVHQYDKNAVFIREFPSRKNARDCVGSHIYINGVSICYGFLWVYEGDPPPSKPISKRIGRYTKQGELIEMFDSAKSARESLGVTYINMKYMSHGSVWKWEDDRNRHPGKHARLCRFSVSTKKLTGVFLNITSTQNLYFDGKTLNVHGDRISNGHIWEWSSKVEQYPELNMGDTVVDDIKVFPYMIEDE